MHIKQGEKKIFNVSDTSRLSQNLLGIAQLLHNKFSRFKFVLFRTNQD